jgi:hypothetical protein
VDLALALEEACRPHVSAILLYGSRLVGTSPDAHSAYDFVVIVDAYMPFYEALADAIHHPRSARILAGLSRVLPPNVMAFEPDLPGYPVAKCLILSGQHFERALTPSAPDHFVKGRMAQSVAIVRASDRRVEAWVRRLIVESRRDVLRWAGPELDEPFSPAELARRMLTVSYRGEVRPESRDRVDQVFWAQRTQLERLYAEVLEESLHRGRVEKLEDGRYRLLERPGLGRRLGLRLYFTASKARAVLRWFKHVLTFANWLTYLQRKVERRTGRPVELTERERKYPLVFLWPRVFRTLRDLPERAPENGTEGGRRS